MKRFYGFAFFERIGGEFDKIKELAAEAVEIVKESRGK